MALHQRLEQHILNRNAVASTVLPAAVGEIRVGIPHVSNGVPLAVETVAIRAVLAIETLPGRPLRQQVTTPEYEQQGPDEEK